MKPRIIHLVLALAATATLHAQDGPPRGHRPPPSPLVIALDTDKDHTISAEEIAAAPTSLLTLDEDKNGSLSKEELRPAPPKEKEKDDSANSEKPEGPPPADDASGEEKEKGPRKRPLPPILVALDKDKDKTLSAEEIKDSATALATLDKNKDGELTPDEFHPARPEGGRKGGRPPGPPEDSEDAQ